MISRIKTTEKIAILTFDDGPNNPYTLEIGTFLSQKK